MSFIAWLQEGGDYVIVLAAIVSAICAICAAVYRAYKFFRSPHDKLEEKVDDGIKRHEHYDKCLDNDNKRINYLDGGYRLMLRALMQLITHELDGKHVDKLEETRDAIHDYLIEN